jgi:hypothetical protein
MTSSQNSNPKWWIESPEVLPENNPSFLCAICQRISFKFLIFECPLQYCLEEIPLDSYENILKKQYCGFCRLIKNTLDNTFGVDAMLNEYQGQVVKLSMVSTWEAYDETLPRQLLLWVKPNPFDSGKPPLLEIQNIQEGNWIDGTGQCRLIQPSRMDFLLALAWIRVCRMGLLLYQDPPPGNGS